MMGAFGSVAFQKSIGHFIHWTGNYTIPFAIAGSAYLSALLVIHLLVPGLEPIKLRNEGAFTIET